MTSDDWSAAFIYSILVAKELTLYEGYKNNISISIYDGVVLPSPLCCLSSTNRVKEFGNKSVVDESLNINWISYQEIQSSLTTISHQILAEFFPTQCLEIGTDLLLVTYEDIKTMATTSTN